MFDFLIYRSELCCVANKKAKKKMSKRDQVTGECEVCWGLRLCVSDFVHVLMGVADH